MLGRTLSQCGQDVSAIALTHDHTSLNANVIAFNTPVIIVVTGLSHNFGCFVYQ